MAYYLIVLVRIVFAPLILVWPAPAIILSLFLDIIDADFAHHVITKKQYQIMDKILDSWVYIFELILAWTALPQYRYFLLALFIWRFIGLGVFLKYKNRNVLLIFGNYFENMFFLLYFAQEFKSLNFILENKTVFYTLTVFSFISKIFQEWFIHVADLSIREDFFKSKRKWKK